MDTSDSNHNRAPDPEGATAPATPVAGGEPAGPAETLWDTFVHAVRGTGGDPTSGPIRRAVILLAIPMVLEMVMESLFAVVDIYFVSKLGDHAMAGVALTESGITIIYTLAAGLSIGVTAMVARRVGEGDRGGAARAAAQAIFVGIFVALVFGVSGVVFAADILRIMGADAEVVAAGLPYTRIMLGGNIVILLLFLQNAAFRGAGDAAIAMRVLWIANGLNIILDPLLIFGVGPFPELGVQGAAIATTIGRGAAVLVQLHTLLRRGGHSAYGGRTCAYNPPSWRASYASPRQARSRPSSRRPAGSDSSASPRNSAPRRWPGT